jgi:hypothetical protein
VRERDGRFAAADPWSLHHRLTRILGDLATLILFMLHAPLADLLAESKAGKLAATSNAICHGYRDYQQFGERENL